MTELTTENAEVMAHIQYSHFFLCELVFSVVKTLGLVEIGLILSRNFRCYSDLREANDARPAKCIKRHVEKVKDLTNRHHFDSRAIVSGLA